MLPLIFLNECTTRSLFLFLVAAIGVTVLFIVLARYSLNTTYEQVLNLEINPRHMGMRKIIFMLYGCVFVSFVLFIISSIKSIVLYFGKK